MAELFLLGVIGVVAGIVIVVVVRLARPRSRPPSFEQMAGLLASAKETMERWPTTEGEVIASTVIERKTHGIRLRVINEYQPQIEVRYEVGGRLLSAPANAYFRRSSDAGWAQEIVERYPVGRRVTVRYDPERPSVVFVDLDSG